MKISYKFSILKKYEKLSNFFESKKNKLINKVSYRG